MKAAVMHAFNEPFKVENVELGDPRDGEVRVKLAASGVCHSDLSIQRGLLPMMPPAKPCRETGNDGNSAQALRAGSYASTARNVAIIRVS